LFNLYFFIQYKISRSHFDTPTILPLKFESHLAHQQEEHK